MTVQQRPRRHVSGPARRQGEVTTRIRVLLGGPLADCLSPVAPTLAGPACGLRHVLHVTPVWQHRRALERARRHGEEAR